ncbi:MAG TPA: hypothetical protein VGS20_14960 [Candidatus Acidoferrales bacterium]|nr:hypothetical protein [Candidatus Acidoferrales bacterium]
MSQPTKVPYRSPELRVYGTLRDLTLTASGTGIDFTPSCASSPHHVSVSTCP